jgi:glycosyltransferase involved in cell wall biosynthesis
VALIVHSNAVKKSLEKNGVPTTRAVVIPQGSYIGMYGSPPSGPEARRSLGLPPTGRVVLFFGLIRPYKGVPELLTDWSDSSYEGTLVIAGSCPDPVLRAEIETKSAQDPSVFLHLEFVPDAEVPWYLAASDCVGLPFRSSTTSSSALLALSFAKPVVAPRIGALEDLPAEVGYFYDHSDESGLHGALVRFFAEGELALRHRSEVGHDYAETLAWPAIAEQTLTLYRTVIATSPPGPSGSMASNSRTS